MQYACNTHFIFYVISFPKHHQQPCQQEIIHYIVPCDKRKNKNKINGKQDNENYRRDFITKT